MLNKAVLIVERNPEEARHIVDFFQNHHFRNDVVVVRSKAEAIDFIFATGVYAKQRHETPGLILLDLETNRTKDVSVLKPLQAYLRTQLIPIIILTSSSEQEAELSKAELGVVGYLRKPLEFTHFIELIQHMGMRKWPESDV